MPAKTSSPAALDYATPDSTLPHTRLGIAATVILSAVVVWCVAAPPFLFPWPTQLFAGFGVWLVGAALAIASCFVDRRRRLFANVSLVLVVVAFLVWALCLPSV